MTKSYSTINLFIRSSIFWLYSILSIIFFSFLCFAALPFSLHSRHIIIRAFLRSNLYVLKKVCLLDYQVHGLENIPSDRTGIILSKHQSTLETFLLPLIFHTPAVIVKRELLWVPFFGWGLAISDPIAIDRKSKATAMQQIINKGKKCLEQGRWILMFPEGTRIAWGQVGQYKLGGARLAAATGYPVIPVAHNAGRYWPRKKFIKQPGTAQIVIGPLIESQNRSAEEILALTKDWIETTVVRIDAGSI